MTGSKMNFLVNIQTKTWWRWHDGEGMLSFCRERKIVKSWRNDGAKDGAILEESLLEAAEDKFQI